MSDLFRNEERDREEASQLASVRRENRLNLKALFYTLAIVIAPFLALLIDTRLALGVLAAGLLFSTFLTWKGSSYVSVSERSRMRVMAGLNFAVFLMVVLVLVMWVMAK